MNLRYKPHHYQWILHFGLANVILGFALVIFGTSWLWLLGSFIVYSFMAMINSAGFHRLFAHRSYTTTPFWEAFLLFCGTLTSYGSSFVWCVVHHQHHKHSDTERDPHKFDSVKSIFTANYEMNKVDYSAKKVIRKLMDKPYHSFVHRHYWAFPIAFSLILGLISLKALVFLYWAPIGLVILSAGIFNYIAHNENGPTNTAYYALQASGEWRHKLHHEQPWRWDLREKWYHLDPAAYFIRLIKND